MTGAALQAASATLGMQREHERAGAEATFIKRLIKRSAQPDSDARRAALHWGGSMPTDLSVPAPSVIKRLIIGPAATHPTPTSAGRKQVDGTGFGISLLSPRVIKRLIIGLQSTPYCNSIEATSGADEEMPGSLAQVAGSDSLVENLLHPESAHIGRLGRVMSSDSRGLPTRPASCVIKRLISSLAGSFGHAPALRAQRNNAEWGDVAHVIKHLIPPGRLPTGTPRSLANFLTTEPCSAGFSRFWGATLQKRRL